MKKLYFLLASLLLSVAAFPSQTTEGTEFWVTYMNNGASIDESDGLALELIISSRNNTEIVVENPRTGWKVKSSVSANTVKKITVPCSEGYIFNPATIYDAGIRVTSTAPISLYASNYSRASYDATIVLPITGIGDDYIIQTYESGGLREFCIVATEDNTQLTIIPNAETYEGRERGVAYSGTLNMGQAYMVMSEDNYYELSGSQVKANKPIAVFAGHICVNVPDPSVAACDHIVEQQVPISQLGKNFALTKTSGQSYDVVRVTATQNNTIVKLNGTEIVTLGALESYSFILSDNSAFLETSNPAICYLYLTGAQANPNEQGDPSSVLISPIEQRLQEITFATFQTELSRDHYVNIVTSKLGAQYVELDHLSITNKFSPLAGNNNLYFAQIPISHGTHTLKTNSEGFIGHVYGLGWCESYAYSIGSSTLDLSGQITINGVINTEMDTTIERCYKKPITFAPQTNDEYDEILWNFGDGNTSNQETPTHTYAAPGTYEISMMIANEDGRDTAYTHLTLVDALHDTIDVQLCRGESFIVGGESYTYTKSGQYNITIPSVDGCDSIITVDLFVMPVDTILLYDTVCDGRAYIWEGENYYKSGVYTKTYINKYGCDSTMILNLTVSAPYNHEISDTICSGEVYSWDGLTYNTTGDYPRKYTSIDGCDSIVTLHLTVGEEYDILISDTICNGDKYIYEGVNYTKTGVYTHTYSSQYGCDSIVTLHLTVGDLYNISIYDTICDGETYTWDGTEYTQSGVYPRMYTSRYGCDSLVTLNLLVADVYDHVWHDTICSSETFTWNGVAYNKTGSYTQFFKSQLGCDSIVTLNLKVAEAYDIHLYDTICDSEVYTWNGVTYSKSGAYTQFFTSQHGCDSTVTVHLLVAPIVFETIIESICQDQPYYFGREIIVKPGVYVDTAVSMHGCDSITTLYLQVSKPYLIDQYIEVCHDDTFTFRGMVINEPGIYYDSMLTVHGCDSVYRLIYNKTPTYLFESEDSVCVGSTYKFRGKNLTRPGIYYDSLTTVSGCDSIFKLTLHNFSHSDIYSIQVADVCGDDQTLQLIAHYEGHRPEYYNIIYSKEANDQGFKNIIQVPYTSDTIEAPMPNATPYIRPDYYAVTLQLGNYTCPQSMSEHTTDFLIRYPSWIIEQNWQDVVAVLNAQHNGGYYFQSYEWYVNNQPAAQNNSYLYLPTLRVGDEVVLNVMRSGENYYVPTCPIYIEKQDTYTQENPIPVDPARVSCKDRQVTLEALSLGVEYYLYDIMGRCLVTGVCSQGQVQSFELPEIDGSYFLTVVDTNGKQQTVHFMVE